MTKSFHGIWLSKTPKIVEYEMRFGPIDIPEELLAIKGIGENVGKGSREDDSATDSVAESN